MWSTTTASTAGDDGSLHRGASLRYTDNGDGTVTDTNTGLISEKENDDPASTITTITSHIWHVRAVRGP